MKKQVSLIVLLILIGSIQACTNQNDNVISSVDQAFIKTAYQDNQADIQMSQIARTRGVNTRLITFAQQLIQKSSLTTDKLNDFAVKRDVVVPVELSASATQKIQELLSVPNKEFDQSYVMKIIESRTKTINLYEQQIKNSKDNALRQWASQKLSDLYKELDNAQVLQGEMK